MPQSSTNVKIKVVGIVNKRDIEKTMVYKSYHKNYRLYVYEREELMEAPVFNSHVLLLGKILIGF